MKTISIILFSFLSSSLSFAEPTSGLTKVSSIRSYVGANLVYIETTNNFCNTNTFVLDTSLPNGKQAYAAVLAGKILNSNMQIEVETATGCAGWGTRIQSVYLR